MENSTLTEKPASAPETRAGGGETQRPIILHYVLKREHGDRSTFCGELIPAKSVWLERDIKSDRPRVMCPLCELRMQLAADHNGKDYVRDYLHGDLSL